MPSMARKKPKPVAAKWAKKLAALQERLDLDNAGMAAKFGVEERTYISWKYGERNPSPSALVILSLLSETKQ